MPGILLNLLAATTGGQVTRAEGFLQKFRDYAPNTRLVILKDCNSLSFINETNSWEIINVRIGSGRFRALRRTIWENWALLRLMRSKDLDIYLTFSHYLPKSLLVKKVFSIVGVSNLAPFSRKAWEVEGNIVRLKMRLLRHTIISSSKRADQVIALSSMCKDVLVKHGIDPSKIHVIPNGVEIYKPISQDSRDRDQPLKRPFILSVSHFYRYKNYECLIEAFSLLPVRHRDQYKLVIIGKPYDSKYYKKIISMIEKLGIKDNVEVILGADRATLDLFYRNASLFIFTSLIENSPNILLEAMAYSLPIVASNAAPMPEFGSNGVQYYEALSAIDLVEKIDSVLSDKKVKSRLSMDAKLLADKYLWENFTKSVLEITYLSYNDKFHK